MEINKKYGYEQSYDIVIILNSLRYELQAIRSPNPIFFPEQDRIIEINREVQNLQKHINQAVADIHEFATENLSVEDFFRLQG